LPFLSAAGLSLVWLLAFALTVTSGADWPGLGNLSPIGLAAVIAAAVLPMALIWAVTAVVSQTLAAARSAPAGRPRRGAGDDESLARTVIMMQEQARRRDFLDSADLGLRDLCAHLGQIMDRLGIVDRAEMETQWALTAAGYPWAIPNTFLHRAELSGPGFADRLAERLAEDGPSAAATQRFLRRHALIEELARANDVDRLLRAILEDGPMERVALMLEDADARMRAILGEPAPAQLAASAELADDGDGLDMIDPIEDLDDLDILEDDEDVAPPPQSPPAEPPRDTQPAMQPPMRRGANRRSLAEHLERADPPPAGGRGTPEPPETAEDIARRLPYPPLSGSEMASIQERVARSLSRTGLSRPRDEIDGEGAIRRAAIEAGQFDMFGPENDEDTPPFDDTPVAPTSRKR
jgi:hypothetical protein